jgi:hypothetical protein
VRHSEVDKRAKRNAPRQSVSDTGHKDAPASAPAAAAVGGTFVPLRDELRRLRDCEDRS